MTSPTQKKKLKTLTTDAIITIRQLRYNNTITRERLERVMGIDMPMASRVISALQKKQIVGRPDNNPAYHQDPYSRMTRFPVNLDKLKASF